VTAAHLPIPPSPLRGVLGALAEAFPPPGTGDPRTHLVEMARVLYPYVYCTGGRPVPESRPDAPLAAAHLRRRLAVVLGSRAHQDRAAIHATGGPVDGRTARVRFYGNLTDAAAPGFVARAVAALDTLGVPFDVKCVPTPSWRTDRVVVYVPRDTYLDVHGALEPLAQGPGFRPEVPLCTHRLGTGWGTAEDPADGLSFGQDRCLLIAEALWTAAVRGAVTPAEVVEIAAEVFDRNGVSLDRPHLARHAAADYTVPAPRRRPRTSHLGPTGAPTPHLDRAARLARGLAGSALWSGDRCTWLDAQAGGPGVAAVTRPVGADVYAGTSGVALALAQVAVVTGDRAVARTAAGAARQAVARVEGIPVGHRLGYFAGQAGAAAAVAAVGRALDDGQLVDSGTRLLHTLRRTPLRSADRDLVTGAAGALLVLGCSPEGHDDDALRLWGADLAALLVAGLGAEPEPGVAHGDEGKVLALLEFGAAIGDPVLVRIGADGAARLADTVGGDPVSWCLGATGRALLHLRVFHHLGDTAARERASAVVGTALRAAAAGEHLGDLTLCHGTAGVADLAVTASAVLGEPALQDAARALVAPVRLPAHGTPLPEVRAHHGFQTSGLLLGIAGWTVLNLRLQDPGAAPTPFLPPDT
jgi:hypothetical protein